MAIPNLVPTEYSSFVGKNTDDNLVKTAPEYLLVGKNVICQGDDTVKTCPGYTLVKALGTKVIKTFDWQRPSDKQQFTLAQYDANLAALTPGADGKYSAGPTVLSSTEDPSASFDFITSQFAAYANNGKSAYRILDKGGVMKAFKWGIAAPTVAPTLAFGAGSLTLKYGRRYCYSFVSYVTDAAGTQRMHIGPPSPLSAHTGPQTSQVVTLGSLQVSADQQVTHIWVFSTVDTPLDTSSVYYFEAELTTGTTSFGDTLADSALDTTRLAPFDNQPAPLGTIVLEYQNRAVIIDPSSGNVYFSGFEEIDLGDPLSSFPSDLFFEPPAGTHKPTGGAVVDDGDTLLVGTEEAWTKLTGYNAQTFQMKERIISPGPVGKDAITRTPTHLVWLSRDKKLNAWDTRLQGIIGVPAMPIDLSQPIQQKLAGTYSMEDLKDTELANAKVAWFAYGKHHYVVCAGNTIDEPTKALNWIQLWYVAFEEGQIKSVGETDFIPSDLFASMANVMVGSTPYLFFGGYSDGNLYRWPDGFQHNGKNYIPEVGTAWSLCEFEGNKQFYWADLITDRMDAAQSFGVSGVVSGAPNMNINPTPLPMGAVTDEAATDPMACRANMMVQGTSFGKYARLLIQFPADGQQATLKKIEIYSRPIYSGAP